MSPVPSPEESARAALRLLPPVAWLAAAPFDALEGGRSNHSWKAQWEGRDFYLRLGYGDEASLGVDRRSEALLLSTASESGLAPLVLVCEPRLNLLVTEWIEGWTWSRREAVIPSNVRRVARALARVHSMYSHPDLHRVDFAEAARHLESQLAGSAEPPGTLELAARVQVAFRRLAACARPLVPCHNDLHHQNLLDDGGRLWLVDWEYGGLGDPLFDLAGYCCHHGLDPAKREILVEEHGGLSASDRDLLADACLAFDYVQLLWYRVRRLPPPPELCLRLGSPSD